MYHFLQTDSLSEAKNFFRTSVVSHEPEWLGRLPDTKKESNVAYHQPFMLFRYSGLFGNKPKLARHPAGKAVKKPGDRTRKQQRPANAGFFLLKMAKTRSFFFCKWLGTIFRWWGTIFGWKGTIFGQSGAISGWSAMVFGRWGAVSGWQGIISRQQGATLGWWFVFFG